MWQNINFSEIVSNIQEFFTILNECSNEFIEMYMNGYGESEHDTK